MEESAMIQLDWLLGKKGNIESLPDRVWMSEQAKYAGIAREAAQALDSDDPPSVIVLVAHFSNVLAELEATADRAGLDRRGVRCALAQTWEEPLGASLGEVAHSLIIVGERHPLRSHDEAVIKTAASASGRSRLVFHLSLEDPLMQRFSNAWVGDTLKRLGMGENTPIKSKMVSRRLRMAQKKIEADSTNELPAESAEEWLRINRPD
jgi:hypothetical protein